MKLFPACMSCLVDQVERAIRLINPDINGNKIINAQKKLMQILIDTDFEITPNILMGKAAYSIIGEVLQMDDPYREHKKKFNFDT